MATPASFLDIGETLGMATAGAGGQLSLELFPFVLDILRAMSKPAAQGGLGHRLGVISNTGTESAASMQSLLANAGLLPLLDSQLLLFSSVEGIDKSKPALFVRAAQRAGVPAGRCLYVGENATERAVASQAGFNVAFHLLHAFHVARAITR